MAEEVQTDTGRERDRPASARPAPPAPAASHRASPFRILKAGQGVRVRWASALGAGVLALSMAHFVWNKIRLIRFVEATYYVRTLAPVVVLLLAAYLIFWVVGRKQSVVDFMIQTEGEMKKVNWSTRREVWGATRVVIVTVLALAILLFAVDMFFIFFFGSVGVLRFDLTSQLFGREAR